MIGTSAVLQEDSPERYLINEPPIFQPIEPELPGVAALELLVTDKETARSISRAMISIDSIGRTAVCDEQGKAVLKDVKAGRLVVDVIVCGYTASSVSIHISANKTHALNIKMSRNC
ncbi:MAG: carboxypeptidase-like regulatory domain-containing protein [Daejeonella sp.]|uniref:carboxypeptidase-like regulatory domain-containing protein n=1 Tax=Daejeonella sp. JGW-45 TaxID=3034148 RepID=UPI0023EDBE02|nr:carboxypeptidase-like regulatory domain-containing protein [Daejeonella sp. JGW-45]